MRNCLSVTIEQRSLITHVDVDVERFAGAGLGLFARLLTNVITIYFT